MQQELKVKLRKYEDIESVLEIKRDGEYLIFKPKDGMKICNKCFFVWKSFDFSKNKKSPDGLRSECRNCSATINEKSKEEMKKLREILNLAIKNKDDKYFPFNLKNTLLELYFTANTKRSELKAIKKVMFDYYDKLQQP